MDVLPGDQSERILMGETALKVWREYRGRTLKKWPLGPVSGLRSCGNSKRAIASPEEAVIARLADGMGVPAASISPEDYLTDPPELG